MRLVKGKLEGMDLAEYVTEEAIKIALMGPFGSARYVIQELVEGTREERIGKAADRQHQGSIGKCPAIDWFV